MKILALILARGGSKRLPGKNIQILGDKPLVVWSIDVVKGIHEICDILVSTDNQAIASVCKDAGAFVPWLRPVELATDTATSVDAALHAIDWYEAEYGKINGLLLLQPTSPFRTKETVRRGIQLFNKNSQNTVVGVSPSHTHPMWTFKMDGDYLVPIIDEHGLQIRSQDLPQVYVVNGSFYLISPAKLKENKSFFGKKTIPLVIESQKEFLDIDTALDFQFAEFLINQ